MAKGRRTGGRKAGTPNRVTSAIKSAVQEAFERAGGVEYLVKVAKEDPRTFCGLLSRLLPQEFKNEGIGVVNNNVLVLVPAKLTEEAWRAQVAEAVKVQEAKAAAMLSNAASETP